MNINPPEPPLFPPHQHQLRFTHCTYFASYTYNTLRQSLAGYFLSAYSHFGSYTGPGGLCIPISTFTSSFATLLLQQSTLADYHYNIERLLSKCVSHSSPSPLRTLQCLLLLELVFPPNHIPSVSCGSRLTGRQDQFMCVDETRTIWPLT